MKSDVANALAVIGGHKTGLSLGHAFWQVAKEIAWARESTLSGPGTGWNIALRQGLALRPGATAPGCFRIQKDSAAECGTMDSIAAEIR
jgi:hypothetical protein